MRNISCMVFLMLLLLSCCTLVQGEARGINQPPSVPYIIRIIVVDSQDSPLENVEVHIINTGSNETLRGFTDVDGRFVAGLSRYSDGDNLDIFAVEQGKNAGISILVNLTESGKQANIPHVVTLVLEEDGTQMPLMGITTILFILILLFLFWRHKRKDEDGRNNKKHMKESKAKAEKRNKKRGK